MVDLDFIPADPDNLSTLIQVMRSGGIDASILTAVVGVDSIVISRWMAHATAPPGFA